MLQLVLGLPDGLPLRLNVIGNLSELVHSLGLVLTVNFDLQLVFFNLEFCLRFELLKVSVLTLNVVELGLKFGFVENELVILFRQKLVS